MAMQTLTTDALELVFDEAAKDTVGNHVVPGLAQLSGARVLCKGIRDAAAAIATVYDADIEYEAYGRTTVPVRFRGGLWFGVEMRDSWFSSEGEVECPTLAVIRDKRSSRMFVVSAGGYVGSRWHSVGRMYVVAQLAQLLGGHTSDWSRRLPNLHEVAYRYSDVDKPLSTRYHSITPVDHSLPLLEQPIGIVRKNQLTAHTWNGVQGGGFTVHDADFISHLLEPGVTNAGRTTWTRSERGALTMTTVRCEHSGGANKGYMNTRILSRSWNGTCQEWHDFRAGTGEQESLRESRVHDLSRAFGWYSVARQAEGSGWLVSLLSDQYADDDEPALLGDCRDLSIDDLMNMASSAKKARQHKEWLRTQPYHATGNPTGYRKTKKRGLRERGHRAAKAVAMDRMRQRSESDVEFDQSDAGEDALYVQPKRPRRNPSPILAPAPAPAPAPKPAPKPNPEPRTMFEVATALRAMIGKYETPEDRARQLSWQMALRGVNACGCDN